MRRTILQREEFRSSRLPAEGRTHPRRPGIRSTQIVSPIARRTSIRPVDCVPKCDAICSVPKGRSAQNRSQGRDVRHSSERGLQTVNRPRRASPRIEARRRGGMLAATLSISRECRPSGDPQRGSPPRTRKGIRTSSKFCREPARRHGHWGADHGGRIRGAATTQNRPMKPLLTNGPLRQAGAIHASTRGFS